MPLPRALGRFNVRVTNRILGPIVVWIPGFGRVVHVGRRSGRVYRTPVLLFRDGDRAVFALTYGPDTEWVRNVLAAEECSFETRRGTIRLTAPRRVHDPSRRLVPWFVRLPLRLLRASDFLVVDVVPPARAGVVGT